MKKIIFALSVICFFSVSAVAAPQAEYTTLQCEQIAYTRPEIVFSPDGSDKKFILLDENEDGYLVLAFDMYGARAFDPDNTEKFNPDDSNNIAGWLNGEFIKNGNYYNKKTYKMPEAIIRNAVEHDWVTEAGGPHTDFREDYVARCVFAVPSKTEVMQYYDVFGYADDTSIASMLLRTSSGSIVQTGGTMLNYVTKHITKAGMIRNCSANKNYGLRPIFCLDGDFFKKERIDLTTAGDDIRKLIKTKHTVKELSEIYSTTEISKLTAPLPPQARNVRVTGNPIVGETLKCTYDYYAPDGQIEEGTKITWVRYNESQTVGYTIPNADTDEYTLTKEDVGKAVSARVTPACADKRGRVTEAVFYRNDMLETVDVSDVYIDELKIKGRLTLGGNAYAYYKYFHPAYFTEKNTQYIWLGSTDKTSYEEVEGEKERALDIPEDFAYKYLKCIVTTQNGKRYVSEPVEITPPQEKEDGQLTGFSLHSKARECKAGDVFVLDGAVMNNVHTVSFTVDARAVVSAEHCTVYKAKTGDKTLYAVTKNTSDSSMKIEIRTDYDGVLSVENISAAILK